MELTDTQREQISKDCHHFIHCACTAEQRRNAMDSARSGLHPEAVLGFAMLDAPCLREFRNNYTG